MTYARSEISIWVTNNIFNRRDVWIADIFAGLFGRVDAWNYPPRRQCIAPQPELWIIWCLHRKSIHNSIDAKNTFPINNWLPFSRNNIMINSARNNRAETRALKSKSKRKIIVIIPRSARLADWPGGKKQNNNKRSTYILLFPRAIFTFHSEPNIDIWNRYINTSVRSALVGGASSSSSSSSQPSPPPPSLPSPRSSVRNISPHIIQEVGGAAVMKSI